MGTVERIRNKLTRESILRTTIQVGTILAVTAAVLLWMTISAVNDVENQAEEANVTVTIDGAGEAYYTGEVTDEEGIDRINNIKIDAYYEHSMTEVEAGELRYARDGFVYRGDRFGIPVTLVYGYNWVPVEKGKTHTATVSELVQEKEGKLILTGLVLSGSITGALVMYVVLGIVGYILMRFYRLALPIIIGAVVMPRGSKKEDINRLEIAWKLLLKNRLQYGNETAVLRIAIAVLYGLGGFLQKEGGYAQTIDIILWYSVLYGAIALFISRDIYTTGKKLGEDLEQEKKGKKTGNKK